MTTYQLGKTVKNKLLNYKETVNSIFLDEKVAFSLKIATFESEHSQFCDLHHKHIITGDSRITDNSKLKKLKTKGPNYRDPGT